MKISDSDFEKLLQSVEKHSYNKTIAFQGAPEKPAGRPASRRLAVIAVAALLSAGLIAVGIVTAAKTANHGIPTPPDVTETVSAPVTEKDTETGEKPNGNEPVTETDGENIQTAPEEDTTAEDITDIQTDPEEDTTEAEITDIQTEPNEDTTVGDIPDIQTEPDDETTEPVTHTDTEEVTTSKEDEDPKPVYKIYLYTNGEGGEGDYSTEKYVGKRFLGTAERTNKTNMDIKTIEMFGSETSMSYMETLDFKLYDEKYDMYIGNSGLFTFGEKTGRLVTYDYLPNEEENGFTPPVNKHSSRQEFINYAKTVLFEYTGVSTDDCDVFIKTTGIETNYKRTEEEYRQDFQNFIDKDPDFSAEYEIVFRKKFSDIYRIDDITVTVRNDGTILQIKSRVCSEKYEPFFNVDINTDHLIDQIKDISYDPRYLSYNILLRAIPDGKELWVLAEVEYEYEDSGNIINSGRQYITKVIGSNDGPISVE